MSPAARRGDRLIVGGVPRAELLPPELELEKKARGQRRGLITVFVLIVVLVGVAYGAVSITAAAVQLALDGENQRTTELLNAQNEYIEVRQLAAQVAASESAHQIGTSTEIDWLQFMIDISDRMPPELYVFKINMTSGTPIAPFGPTVVPLEQPRVTEILIQVNGNVYGPQGTFLKALEDIPGFADASLETVKLEDGEYESTIRLHLNQDVYTNRYADEDSE